MSSQPIPTISAADVERIARRDFPAAQVPEVLALLGEYGRDSRHRETHRVQLAAMKLAEGSLKQLRIEIENAKCDYRDTLAAAEYPGYCRKVPGPGTLPADTVQRIIKEDWQQYQDWLNQ